MKPFDERFRFLFLGKLLGFSLTVVLPLFFPLLMLDFLFSMNEEDSIAEIQRKMGEEIEFFSFAFDPTLAIFQRFSSLYKLYSSKEFAENAIRNSNFPFPRELNIEVGVFGQSGELIMPKNGKLTYRTIFKKLWADLPSPPSDSVKAARYKTLFGGKFSFQSRTLSEGKPNTFFLVNTNRLFIWKRFGQRSGLFFFVPAIPSSFSVAKTLVPRVKKGFLGVCAPLLNQFICNENTIPGWKESVLENFLEGKKDFRSGGYFCRLKKNSDGFIFVRAERIKSRTVRPIRFLLWSGFLLIVIHQGRRWRNSDETPLNRLNLRNRLLLFFLIALIVPEILLFVFGTVSYKSRAEVLEQTQREAEVSRLKTADQAFRKNNQDLLKLFRKLRDHPALQREKNEETFTALKDGRKKLDFTFFQTNDQEGRILIQETNTQEDLTLYDAWIREGFRVYLDIELPVPTGFLGRMSKLLMEFPLLAFENFIDFPDTLVKFGPGLGALVYWDIGPPSGDGKKVLTLASIGSNNNFSNFLKNLLPEGIWAYDRSSLDWFPGSPRIKKALLVVSQAMEGSREVHRKVKRNGKTFLISAIPSSTIPNCGFLSISPLDHILAEIDKLYNVLLLATVMSLFAGMYFGNLLTTTLLDPISRFSDGIGALEKGNYQFRLPDLGNDEFGEMAVAFNRMMGEFKEVNLGKEVQNKLIPFSPPKIEGYDTFLFNRAATHLGGDYCDVLVNPSGNVVFLVGDVTGHGIGAALVMAMAKMVTHVNVSENNGLMEILRDINSSIAHLLKSKRLISVVAGLLDPKKHELEWVCVGHPYPFLFDSDGNTTEFEMRGIPLGSRKSLPLKTAVHRFEVGESLFFYSDGTYEAMNLEGVQLGFGRFKESFGRNFDRSLGEIGTKVIEEIEKFSSTVPQQDDITLLGIRRLK